MKTIRRLTSLALLVLLAAGCGGGDAAPTDPGGTDEPDPELELSQDTVRMTRIGEVERITARVGAQSTTRPDYVVDGEARWLDGRAILDAEQLASGRLQAAAPGTATLEVTAFDKGPKTLIAIVEPEEPVVLEVAADEPVTQGDSLILQGYEMDALAEDALTVDGEAAVFVRADSATYVATAPDVSAATETCEGNDMLSLAVSGVRVHGGTPEVRGVRPDAMDLEVGEVAQLDGEQADCLKLAGEAGGARYALAYLDPSNIDEARTQRQSTSDPNDLFTVTAEDWTAGSPTGSATVTSASLSAHMGGGHADMSASTVAASSACTDDDLSANGCDLYDRTSPWQEGDVFYVTSNQVPGDTDGKEEMKVLVVADGYLVFGALERDWDDLDAEQIERLRTLGRRAMDDIVPLYDGAIADGRAVTSPDNGQLFVQVGPNYRTQAPGEFDPEPATRIALKFSANESDREVLEGLAHEMSHAWNLENSHDVRTDAGRPLTTTWGEEGLADLMEAEVVRRRAGLGLREDVRWQDASGELTGFTKNVRRMDGEIEFGYSSTAGFLRRLVLRLMDAGFSYDDAVHEVAVGTAEGWFGRNDSGQKARPGLAGRMQAALGADWTPESALMTWTLAQAADGLTPSATYQNPTFEAAFEGWTPDATLEAAGGEVADLQRRNGSAGYLLLVDEAGEGATYRVDASGTESPVRWGLLRIE